MNAAINVSHLKYAYQNGKTLHFPDFSCPAGTHTLILGKSGVGKTTLLHLLGLLLPIQEGVIEISGTPVMQLSLPELTRFRSEHIGIVFQQNHFIRSLSVQDNLLLANYLAGKVNNLTRAKYLSEQLGIEPLLKRKVFELSGGEMQRVSIARAMMNHPKIILADEPTSSLDDDNCDLVFQLLAENAREAGASLLIVTHDHRLKSKIDHHILL